MRVRDKRADDAVHIAAEQARNTQKRALNRYRSDVRDAEQAGDTEQCASKRSNSAVRDTENARLQPRRNPHVTSSMFKLLSNPKSNDARRNC